MMQKSKLRAAAEKIWGGIEMTWLRVVLLAVGSAALTAVFLIVPIFKGTSFERMGTYTEAWVLFAIFIIANCKKPIEAAVKTFVFFLISQPLIYLFQVPFSWLGWGIFGYYPHWLVLTVLTFPGALIGWYITKRSWLSLLVLSPMLVLLGWLGYGALPNQLLGAIFCFGQIIVYLYVFTESMAQRAVGIIVPLVVVALIAFSRPAIETNGTFFLPDEPALSENAAAASENAAIAEVTIEGEMVRVRAHKEGETRFTITDGDKTYTYHLRIYLDQNRAVQVEITAE
jgi:hypothetical protein